MAKAAKVKPPIQITNERDEYLVKVETDLINSIEVILRLKKALVEAHGAISHWGQGAGTLIELQRLQRDLDAISEALRHG